MDVRPRAFGAIVVSPGGTPDASLAIAASRAGVVGVLNLEFADDAVAARESLDHLRRHARGEFGVLVDPRRAGFLELILAPTDRSPTLIVLTDTNHDAIAGVIENVRQRGCQAYVVVTSAEAASEAERSGADALIAKGHEAGGWVGPETTFVLLQRLLANTKLPVWAYGGVGIFTAAAVFAAGAQGVVLDSQLLLTPESPIPPAVRARIEALDGSETSCFGDSEGASFRAYSRPGLAVIDEIRRLESASFGAAAPSEAAREAWRLAVSGRVGWQDADRQLLAIGQDAAFASKLARQFGTVGGIVRALLSQATRQIEQAKLQRALAEDSPLATSHGTRYPIVQGPMTRVSDRAAFAAEVAAAGGLPFLALALMRGPDVQELLADVERRLEGRPWGVGILGFVPADLRAEQLDVVRQRRPPFALIAGGRPDQAATLESNGIATYLHVPSPGLLQLFLNDGARRFVFEGRECGGHVGPRTSFVLWESMIGVILDWLGAGKAGDSIHVLFAGGIHDNVSAAMVAALAAPLVSRGVRIGVLVGTGYLFCQEAVSSGAIVAEFQDAALRCERTVLLESGPGHATRCAPSAFVDDFNQVRRELVARGLPSEEVRAQLEELNVGRLRIASKGVDRNPDFGKLPDSSRLRPVSLDEQRRQGMYMIGQVAALRHSTVTIAELHATISAGSVRRLEALALPPPNGEPAPPPAAVAIVGMSCILPGAKDLATYWANILNKVDSITEVPADRWDWRQYYDADKAAPDKVYSRWGGFIGDVPFDPVEFGMPPSSVTSIEPFQILALLAVRDALKDAGLIDRQFSRERTSVILGAGGGSGDKTIGYMVRSALPMLFGGRAADLTRELSAFLPEWTEDSFPGFLLNVAAGRAANRLDLGGLNYTVDAACASSLAAVYQGVRELENGTSDVVVVGGVDAIQSPFAFLAFSKTQALSPTGRCKTFDAKADGIAISEGFAMLVLKRLADAERDGDRIYAVLRGVGGSSDGRDRSLTAPRPEGQVRALRRAYAQAGFTPTSVGLIEAHGTGTVAGDQAEIQALSQYFGEAGASVQGTAVGSVKSMIGHTKATAGVAGLIKVALALHHRVLPPTIGVEQPNPKARFAESPFYVNSEPRPWIQPDGSAPRRAGVSAFGFGGTNFHVAVEEYTGNYLPERASATDEWPAELFVWQRADRQEVRQAVQALLEKLERGARPRLRDLAAGLIASLSSAGTHRETRQKATLAIVAQSIDELIERLRAAQSILEGSANHVHEGRGIHFANEPFAPEGKVAFLFPGQGSQSVNMLRDLALHFPEVRSTFASADRVLADRLPQPLSRFVFPPPWFSSDEEARRMAELTETSIAQPALGAADLAVYRVLGRFGVRPELLGGHSYGEFVALHVAGCFGFDDLFRLSEARGRFIREGAGSERGLMAAVESGPDPLRPLLDGLDVVMSNLNAPKQTVISGSRAGVEQALERCAAAGLRARSFPVSYAFHSPIVEPAQRRLAATLQDVKIAPPAIPVYSNTTAAPYPNNPEAIADILSEHLVRPVEFVREVTAMHDAGARVFVEAGPRNVLTGLIGRILGDRPHFVATIDQANRNGITQLLHALAGLVVEGVGVDLPRLFEGRAVRPIDVGHLDERTGSLGYGPTTWLVNGGSARPARGETNGVARLRPIEITLGRGDEAAIPPNARATQTEEPIVSGEPVTEPGAIRQRGVAMSYSGSVTAPIDRSVPLPNAQPTIDSDDNANELTSAVVGSEPRTPQRSAVSMSVAGEVMREFQVVMHRFLETQHSVMLAYLGGAPSEGEPAARSSNGTMSRRTALSPPPRRAVSAPPIAAATASTVRPAVGKTTVNVVAAAVPVSPATNGHATSVVEKAPTKQSSSAEPMPKVSAPAQPTLTQQSLVDQLVGIVSDRTGYPSEMLGLDADLEADLGIDSIKRVEIIGTLVKNLNLPTEQKIEMEPLTSSRTLREIVGRFLASVRPGDEGVRTSQSNGNGSNGARHEAIVGRNGHHEGDQRPFDPAPEQSVIQRYTLRIAPAPANVGKLALTRSGVVVITDDERGVAQSLEATLVASGYRAVRIGVSGSPSANSSALTADFGSAESIANLVDEIHRRHGFVTGLIHAAPLRPDAAAPGTDLRAWEHRLRLDLNGLFLLARALQTDLEGAASAEGASVIVALDLGGQFATGDVASTFFPGHGGLAGWVKTLAQEWPNVRVKVVDVGPADSATAARWILDETGIDDAVVEVGYPAGQRSQIRLLPATLSAESSNQVLPSGSTVLVIGGARGITAETAHELAGQQKVTLLLVGRTPLANAESPETARISDPRELKRAIAMARQSDGRSIDLKEIQGEFQELMRRRELTRNIDRLREKGARVEYFQCDVSDAAAFGALIDTLYRDFGKIDGVVYGAGVIEDKLIRDKTIESFERVVRTKLNGALTLANKLRPESLRFLVFFSSIAGRMGNRGQADYGAANEILNKLAQQLRARWNTRVVAVNWGPWATLGMASEGVQRQFAERGIAVIPVDVGRRMLIDEIARGSVADVEVVIAGGEAIKAIAADDLGARPANTRRLTSGTA